MAVVFDCAVWAGITRNHDGAVWGLEAVTIGMRPLAVMDGESRYGHVLVLVHDARQNLVHVHFVAGGVGMLDVFRPNLDVSRVRPQEMFRHVGSSWRSINFERYFSSHDPWRKYEIREADRVI